ncbi:MAG TPA: efflux RND transporter periplasmic adaptor subunit [Caulobacteraceae bacterium]|nr:efflux RND transporter periplasmic adaptor subunit [Caulobacteraceae bacterium]
MSREGLANQLKIDRDPPVRRKRRRGEGGPSWLLWGAIGLAGVAVIAGVVWFAVARPDLPRIETAQAKAAWSGGAAGGGALLDASGYVVARREATVSAKVSGKVDRVMIEEGQHVEAGQVIATLDDSNAQAALDQATAQAAAAEASVKVAEVTLAQQTPLYRRSETLHSNGWLSDQDLEAAQASYNGARDNLALAQRQAAVSNAVVMVYRRNREDMVVRAPFSGVVTATAAQPGEIVAPVAGGGFTRTGICTIVDMDSLEVEVDVAESFISRVTPGMPASVKLNAYPDWEIPAEVITVIPTADRSKATVTVRVGFKIKDPRIVPEMGAHVAFLSPKPTTAAAATRAVIVPPDAVQSEDSGQSVVFVIEGGKAERRAVRLGDRTAEGQFVIAGLSPGETVAVEGADHLKDGQAVRVTRNKTG